MLLTPNLLVHSDGSPVEKNSWVLRRQELAAAIISHQFGDMPPKPTNQAVKRSPTARDFRCRTKAGVSKLISGGLMVEVSFFIQQG